MTGVNISFTLNVTRFQRFVKAADVDAKVTSR